MKLTKEEEFKFVNDAIELMDFIDETSLKHWVGWEKTRFDKLKIDYFKMKETFLTVKETSRQNWTLSIQHAINFTDEFIEILNDSTSSEIDIDARHQSLIARIWYFFGLKVNDSGGILSIPSMERITLIRGRKIDLTDQSSEMEAEEIIPMDQPKVSESVINVNSSSLNQEFSSPDKIELNDSLSSVFETSQDVVHIKNVNGQGEDYKPMPPSSGSYQSNQVVGIVSNHPPNKTKSDVSGLHFPRSTRMTWYTVILNKPKEQNFRRSPRRLRFVTFRFFFKQKRQIHFMAASFLSSRSKQRLKLLIQGICMCH